MPKARPTKERPKAREPLGAELADAAALARFGSVRPPKPSSLRPPTEPEPEAGITDGKLSRNILRIAQEQQEQVAAEEAAEDAARLRSAEAAEDARLAWPDSSLPSHPSHPSHTFQTTSPDHSSEAEASDEEDYEMDEGEMEALGIDDRAALETFLQPAQGQKQSLIKDIWADFDAQGGEQALKAGQTIAFKLGEAQVAAPSNPDEQKPLPPPKLNPKVIEVYSKIGQLLSRYKSGPLPKAFKIMPNLPNPFAVLPYTKPDDWTPHAVYAAVKLFASNMKVNEVRWFYQAILLDHIRNNIRLSGGKLHYQLYEACKKAMFKPKAFFKGILFPLSESGCTLREAAILASVLSKISIPVEHASAAMLRLAEMSYTGANSLFLRVLLDKKYALPYRVIDGMVGHFMRLAQPSKAEVSDDRMPVLWHQSFLVFAQRYNRDITPDQRDALLDVLKMQFHPQISPEVRRELANAESRAEPVPDAEML